MPARSAARDCAADQACPLLSPTQVLEPAAGQRSVKEPTPVRGSSPLPFLAAVPARMRLPVKPATNVAHCTALPAAGKTPALCVTGQRRAHNVIKIACAQYRIYLRWQISDTDITEAFAPRAAAHQTNRGVLDEIRFQPAAVAALMAMPTSAHAVTDIARRHSNSGALSACIQAVTQQFNGNRKDDKVKVTKDVREGVARKACVPAVASIESCPYNPCLVVMGAPGTLPGLAPSRTRRHGQTRYRRRPSGPGQVA